MKILKKMIEIVWRYFANKVSELVNAFIEWVLFVKENYKVFLALFFIVIFFLFPGKVIQPVLARWSGDNFIGWLLLICIVLQLMLIIGGILELRDKAIEELEKELENDSNRTSN